MDDADSVDDEARNFKADATICHFMMQCKRLLHLRIKPLDAVYLYRIRK